MTASARRRSPRRLASAVLAVVIAGSCGTGLADGPAFAAGSPGRQPLPGIRPGWARPAADAGALPASAGLRLRVYLADRDPGGLASYARQVADPRSPLSGHYLTPAEFRRRFGPSPAQVAAVRQWLTGAGLRVTAVTSHYLAAAGDAADAFRAFGTSLDRYRVADRIRQAPRAQVTVPAAVAPAVLTVTGLATSNATIAPDAAAGQGTGATPVNVGRCSDYWGQKPATGLPPAYGHPLSYDLNSWHMGTEAELTPDLVAALTAGRTGWAGLPGSFDSGTGGGTSSLFGQPFYQRTVVPAAFSQPAGTATPMRVIPDIAADEATGMLIGLTTTLPPAAARTTRKQKPAAPAWPPR